MAKVATEIQEPVSKMAALLEKNDFTPKVFSKGERVDGKVVAQIGDIFLVDLGGKSEGIIQIKELQEGGEKAKVGENLTAIVAQPENDSGTVILTAKRSPKEKVWEDLAVASDKSETLEVRAIEANRGGIIVDFQGLRGFVPSSHLVTNAKDAINKKLVVKVIEANASLNKLVFSEKEVAGESLPKIELPFKIGDSLDVIVSKILPFGLLVTAEGGEGLIHISEISWIRVENLADKYKIGAKLKAKVISIDPANGRVNLSIKQLEKDPWEKAAKKYKVGTEIDRKVSRIASYGVFVGLEEGIEGLLHSSKIPYGLQLTPGQDVKVLIDLFNTEQRRVSLRLAVEEESVDNKTAKKKEAKPKAKSQKKSDPSS